MENACIVFDNGCLGFDGAFPLTDFGNCQYEVLKQKFDTGLHTLDKFVKIQHETKKIPIVS